MRRAHVYGHATLCVPLRYDDTNPDAESQEYIDNQAENVAWMGWKPVRVTHSSDYFPKLYQFALDVRAWVIRVMRAALSWLVHSRATSSSSASLALSLPCS
jgi:hypothetical protein